MSTGNPIEIKIVMPQFVFENMQNTPSRLLDLIGHAQLDCIKSNIIDALSDREGGPAVVNMRVTKFEYDDERYAGIFRLHFMISRQFCCSDTVAAIDDYIDFKYEYQNEIMTAQGVFFQWIIDN
ncbi:hypothetical protein [Sphingobacterium sp. JB170]|uniref:hypothetical protein n=1 Tax=Sphingobacterium sp. JB170 TaxID=1434842 RepID=UPI000B363892|nr:hypothetical protein [Sphingobacterium sp. JB170]